MSALLPSTVEELNYFHNPSDFFTPPPPPYIKDTNKDFEDIPVERQYKREFSLPNGVENWNISNFDPYLNFEDNNTPQLAYKVNSKESPQNERLVPEGEVRQRCGSFSSESSSMDDKCLAYPNIAVKTFSTVCVDSGSTCISSDAYMNPSPTMFKGFDAEEKFQNLDAFFKKESDMSSVPSLSPVGSSFNDSNLEYSVLSNFSVSSNCSQDSFSEHSAGIKRSASSRMLDDNSLMISSSKHSRDSTITGHYSENRKRNNAASKNCRKTRKEKQKEMEKRVTDLEREREQLNVQVQVLEEMIQAHKLKLYAILQHKQ